MELAIVNLSNTVLALKLFRLAPGACVKLSDYYNSEKDAMRDKTVAKLLSKGKLVFKLVDFEGIADLSERIAAVEASAAEQRKAERAERFAQDASYRENRKKHRSAVLVQRKVEREQRETEVAEQASMDLGVLYEQSRKQRLIRMVEERQKEALAAAAPPEPEVDPLEPQPEFVEPEGVEVPEEVAAEALEELRKEETQPLEDVEWVQAEMPVAEISAGLSAEDVLETMATPQLRAVLKAQGSEVKSRKRVVLLEAVKALGLSVKELTKPTQE